MKSILKGGALLATFIFLSALPAHADSGATYNFELSGPVSATWTMSENPSPFFVEEGTAFAVDVPDLSMDGGPVIDDTICFFNLSDGGGLNSVVALPDFYGPQVYSGDESNPTFMTGMYTLTMYDGQTETLSITEAPEPTTMLLLFSGLAALGLKRKRQAVN